MVGGGGVNDGEGEGGEGEAPSEQQACPTMRCCTQRTVSLHNRAVGTRHYRLSTVQRPMTEACSCASPSPLQGVPRSGVHIAAPEATRCMVHNGSTAHRRHILSIAVAGSNPGSLGLVPLCCRGSSGTCDTRPTTTTTYAHLHRMLPTPRTHVRTH
jgi:hypothetical protein